MISRIIGQKSGPFRPTFWYSTLIPIWSIVYILSYIPNLLEETLLPKKLQCSSHFGTAQAQIFVIAIFFGHITNRNLLNQEVKLHGSYVDICIYIVPKAIFLDSTQLLQHLVSTLKCTQVSDRAFKYTNYTNTMPLNLQMFDNIIALLCIFSFHPQRFETKKRKYPPVS